MGFWWDRIKCYCLGHEYVFKHELNTQSGVRMGLHCIHCFGTTKGIEIGKPKYQFVAPSIGADVPGGGAI